MHRGIGVLVLAFAFGLAASAAAASPLGDARQHERALRSELQAVTSELEARQVAAVRAEEQLAFDRRQLAAASARLGAARAALAGQVAAMYRTGGLTIADAFLRHDAALIPDRVEMATLLVARQSEVIATAEVARDAHEAALRRVRDGEQQARRLRDETRAAVGRLTTRLEAAKTVTTRLAATERAAQARPRPGPPAAAPARGGISCPVAPPYTYIDSWGAPRSGGRSHQGTDIMAPYGAKVFAYTGGVVSRHSTSVAGGISLYLLGDDGVEYFYAHLSGYAVPAGTRVRAGQLVAYNGQSGNARYTAPHTHFEVHPGGAGSAPVNPYPYVRRACP
jgi:murein DD-endopeptidase MepM/ murein hydrolase activator NlpD